MNVEGLLILAIAMVLGAIFVWHANRRFSVGIMLVFFGMYVKAFVDDAQGLSVGLTIYPLDGVFVLVMAAALARMFFRQGVQIRNAAWLAFGLALGLSFVTGIASYGTPAGVSFRKFFYYFATVAYVMSFRLDQGKIDLVIRSWMTFASVLVTSVVLRWLVDPGLLGFPILRGNAEDSLRVVSADMALILGQSFVLALLLRASGRSRRLWVYLTPMWLAAVVVLQHRSVWLAVLAGLGAAFFLSGDWGVIKRMSRQLIFVSVAGVAGFFALVLSGTVDVLGLVSSLEQAYETAIKLDTTAGERLNSWQVLVGMWAEGGPRAWFFGFPFGTSVVREVVTARGELRVLEYGAHNAYVELLFYTGLSGLILFATIFLRLFHFLYKGGMAQVHPALGGRTLIVLLLMQLCYYVPYGIEFAQAIWVGMGLSLLAYRGKHRADGLPVSVPSTTFPRAGGR